MIAAIRDIMIILLIIVVIFDPAGVGKNVVYPIMAAAHKAALEDFLGLDKDGPVQDLGK